MPPQKPLTQKQIDDLIASGGADVVPTSPNTPLTPEQVAIGASQARNFGSPNRLTTRQQVQIGLPQQQRTTQQPQSQTPLSTGRENEGRAPASVFSPGTRPTAPISPVPIPPGATQQPQTTAPPTTIGTQAPTPTTTQSPTGTTTTQPPTVVPTSVDVEPALPSTRDIEAAVRAAADRGEVDAVSTAQSILDEIGEAPETIDLSGRYDVLVDKYGLLGYDDQIEDLNNQLLILSRQRNAQLAQASRSPTTEASLFGRQSQIQSAYSTLMKNVSDELAVITAARNQRNQIVDKILQYEQTDYQNALAQYQIEVQTFLAGKELELKYGSPENQLAEQSLANLQTYLNFAVAAAIREGRGTLNQDDREALLYAGANIPGFSVDFWILVAERAIAAGGAGAGKKVATTRQTAEGYDVIYEDGTKTSYNTQAQKDLTQSQIRRNTQTGGSTGTISFATEEQKEKLPPNIEQLEKQWKTIFPLEALKWLTKEDVNQIVAQMNRGNVPVGLWEKHLEGLGVEARAKAEPSDISQSTVMNYYIDEQIKNRYQNVAEEITMEYSGLSTPEKRMAVGNLIATYARINDKDPRGALGDPDFRKALVKLGGVPNAPTRPGYIKVNTPDGQPVYIPTTNPTPTQQTRTNADFNVKGSPISILTTNNKSVNISPATQQYRDVISAYEQTVGWDTDNMLAIMQFESRGLSNALASNAAERSYGLFQINALDDANRAELAKTEWAGTSDITAIGKWLRENPLDNIKFAAFLFQNNGYQPWTAARCLRLPGTTYPTNEAICRAYP